METILTLLLYTHETNEYAYFIFLGVGVMVFAYLFATAWQLNRDKADLNACMSHLATMKRRGVEFDMVLQAMKLASWRVDLKTRTVTFDNDYRTRPGLHVLPPNSALGLVFKGMDEADSKKLIRCFDEVARGLSDSFHMQYKMKLETGERYWSEVHATVAERDDNGVPTVLVGTTACIDEQKKMEQELIDARIEAEENDRLKTAFINNISHEVRTPLNAIVGFSDILPSVGDETERESIIAIIKENNAKLLRIFEDMMNISKVEAHDERSNLVITRFDVATAIEETVAKFRTQNANKRLAIDFHAQTDQIFMESDHERVLYIINHFIENAVKFTDEGNVTAGVSVKPDGDIRIWVCDTGRGIAPEDQKRLFDRFYKVDSFVQGAGLGLSVCRSYALSLGGNVGVESRLGYGSTFWAELPRNIAMMKK